MMTFSINQVRSEKALLEKQEQLLKLREEQLVQVDKRYNNIFGPARIIHICCPGT